MAAAVDRAIGGRIQVPGTHGKHQMFELLRFELIVHDSAGEWFCDYQGCYLDNHRNNWRCARAVPALCARCAKTPPRFRLHLRLAHLK